MKVEEILKRLDSYKAGTFVHMEWEKDISSAKAKKLGIKIMKKSSGLIRTDINYDNLSSVQGIERGDKESWFTHYRKGVLQSKKNPDKKYLQAFPIPKGKIKNTIEVATPDSVYNMDGDTLYSQGLINKSALTNVSELDTFIIDIDRIKSFGEATN